MSKPIKYLESRTPKILGYEGLIWCGWVVETVPATNIGAFYYEVWDEDQDQRVAAGSQLHDIAELMRASLTSVGSDSHHLVDNMMDVAARGSGDKLCINFLADKLKYMEFLDLIHEEVVDSNVDLLQLMQNICSN